LTPYVAVYYSLQAVACQPGPLNLWRLGIPVGQVDPPLAGVHVDAPGPIVLLQSNDGLRFENLGRYVSNEHPVDCPIGGMGPIESSLLGFEGQPFYGSQALNQDPVAIVKNIFLR